MAKSIHNYRQQANHFPVTLNSLTETAAWIDAHPIRTQRPGAGSGHKPDRSWDHGMSLDDALDCCRRGGNWAEGAKDLQTVHLEMAHMKSDANAVELENDVAGFFPDVGAYLAGDPCNMYNVDEEAESRQGKVLSIGVHIFQSAGTGVQQKINRGAAIMSTIDTLEDLGYRIELWGVCSASDEAERNGPADPKGCSVEFKILLKAAHESWSPASVAFGIVHPAMYRKIMFRMAESFSELEVFCRSMGRGYSPEGGYDIFFGPLMSSESDWANTKAGALKHVVQMVNEQLESANE